MQNSVHLEMNKPLKYPSNDISVCWPSFQTSSFNSNPIRKDSEINPQMQLSKFSDSESENNQVPKNLENLCSYQNQSVPGNPIYLLLSSEMFLFTKIISIILANILLLFLTFYLPYFYFENFTESDPIYFPVLLFIMTLELHTQFIKILSKFLKKNKISIKLLDITILITYILCFTIQNVITFTILYYLLFLRNLKFIQKLLSLIPFINYQQIIITKMIVVLLFQIHYFTCIWGVELKSINKDDLVYSDYFYKSFLMLFFKFDQLENQQNHLLILTHLFSNIIIIIFLFTIFTQCQSQLHKHDIELKTYKLFLKSNMLEFKVKIVLFHYQKIFLLIENQLNAKENEKKKALLQYIKMRLISQELRHFKFLSKTALNDISAKGVFGLSLKQQNFQAEIDGVYIILAGRVNVNFMGLNLKVDTQKIINICIIEMMNTQQQRKLILEPIDMNDILYFYINQDQFQSCLQKQLEKEEYQMIRDDINFNNTTEELNIQCYFCNLFHPTFNCSCLNIKRRFTYDKTYQERGALFQRKNNSRVKAGIYQQGTSNCNISDKSSDSFEAFSDYSSDKLNVSNQQLHYDQIGKQSSISQIYKDILQIDLISDKVSDPIISSTLIKNLQVPDKALRNQSDSNQTAFQELDSFPEIDKIQEYQHYKVAYNINNVLNKINKQRM
ncbi:unnamed protein product (macronuclear) [Paramecium tetraurelia]|uniref:Cyclic nucleotide-binding domain-containing protein n=1 Tax=Paramecium tetraurelia TaxID=5888 RepID=A0E253_PARTE|nr:uncharacterized protein GSPATT00022542001 [Paramecium tetraurelia]CAK89370.1 unnamed protein product [Paramecium tetraurelia]|eukprot:XP_001456767.1 hypothetical protein (macronuclear) [Paramecium tetraurelia strain d4-2]